MNIIFDLDGTLIDSRYRLYKLFQDLVPESSLDFDDYWSLKRNKVSNEGILREVFSFKESKIKLFLHSWMELIEAPQYLALDKNIDGVISHIRLNLLEFNLYVCTDRQLRDPVISQLRNLGLLSFFRNILVTEKSKTKEDLILSEVKNLSSADWVIGDTGKDIQVGHALKMNTCAVLSGFLSYEKLLPYCPDKIINSVSEFIL